jgi:hypothetical protein
VLVFLLELLFFIFNIDHLSLKGVVANPISLLGKLGRLIIYALFIFANHKCVLYQRLSLLLRSRLRRNFYILENILHFFKVLLELGGGYEHLLPVIRLLSLFLDERLRMCLLMMLGVAVRREDILLPLDLFVYLFKEALTQREGLGYTRLVVQVGVIQLVFFLYLLARLFLDNF